MIGNWVRRTGLFLGLVLLAVGSLLAQEPPELTKEQQTLLKEAQQLNAEAVKLYNEAKLSDATERMRKAVGLFEVVYTREKYPQGHPDLAGRLNNLAFLLEAQGEYAKAEPLCRRALEMYETLYPKDRYPNGHPDLASSVNNLATLLKHQGEYEKAEPLFRRALDMTEALYPKDRYPNGHPDLARSLTQLAFLLDSQGEAAKAESLLRRALDMTEALYPKDRYPNGHPDLARSLNNLAFLLRPQGEYAKAESLLRRALEMRETLYPRDRYPNGHPDLGRSINNLATLLQDQGEYAKSEPLYRRALEMREALYPRDRYPNGHPDLAQSVNNLAALLQDNREYAKAEPLFRRALEMSEALYPKDRYPNGHPELAASLNNLAFLLKSQGEYEKAEPLYLRALETSKALHPNGHPNLASSVNNLAALLHAQGEYAKAEAMYRSALEMSEALYPKDRYPNGHPDLARSLNNLATLLQYQGEYAKAEPLCRRALEMYQMQANEAARAAPEALALNFAATFPLTRDLLLSVTRQLPGSDQRTYDLVWHGKAGLTRVYQRRHLALIAAATDPEVRNAWERLQALRQRREQLLMAPADKGAATRDDRLKNINEDLERAEKDLLPKIPALQHAENLARQGPDALRKRISEKEVLVDFLRYTHFEQDSTKPGPKRESRTIRYLAFVLTKKDVTRLELGTAKDVEEEINDWREAITAKLPAEEKSRRDHEAQLARMAEQIRQLLWEPIQKHLPNDTCTVYLAPDSVLTQLPWAALPGKKKGSILLDDYALAVLPHGPFLLEQLTPAPPRSDKRPPAPEGLLLAGGIHYDDKPALIAGTLCAPATGTEGKLWGALKGTEDERLLLRKLVEKAGPKVMATLSGREASVDRLRQELPQARFAHIATHGFFADKQFRSVLQLDEKLFARRMFEGGNIGERIGEGARSPLLLSGVVCAGANLPDTPDRGILSADAIAGLLLDDLQLAVLSACDTGLGDVAGGEGVYGLQRAFHIAGCHNVVASLWKVDDAATAALMTRFYGHLFHEDKTKRLPPIEALRRAQLDLYRHPELIPAWSKGEARAPGKPRPATTPPPPDTPPELLTSDGRAPIKLWAAFTLSGLGR